uniref:Uncharacterized protein n=1 Tax=uncultured marine bacterium 582 TaxID=257402 RepID=Q6SF03_9BACT|nr:hypothetical protein MBMO_EBAC080-L028H02.83 [uncultured marine bacterium 582]
MTRGPLIVVTLILCCFFNEKADRFKIIYRLGQVR